MSSVTNFFEGFEDYAEGITKEELEFDDFTVDIAIKLRKLREAKGLTQKEVAKRYGCTPQMLCKIESGDYDLRIKTIWKYAKALGYQLSINFTKED